MNDHNVSYFLFVMFSLGMLHLSCMLPEIISAIKERKENKRIMSQKSILKRLKERLEDE